MESTQDHTACSFCVLVVARENLVSLCSVFDVDQCIACGPALCVVCGLKET